MWRGVTAVSTLRDDFTFIVSVNLRNYYISLRKCDSHLGGVKSIRKRCEVMERCDGHVGDVKMLEV